jgi:hypothetical protein
MRKERTEIFILVVLSLLTLILISVYNTRLSFLLSGNDLKLINTNEPASFGPYKQAFPFKLPLILTGITVLALVLIRLNRIRKKGLRLAFDAMFFTGFLLLINIAFLTMYFIVPRFSGCC